MADRDPIHTDDCECDAGWREVGERIDELIREDLRRAYQLGRLLRALGIKGDR